MGQEKKSLYELYPHLIDYLATNIRHSLPKRERPKKSSEVIGRMLKDMPSMINSLDFIVMAEEHFWQRSGAEVIFPESSVVLDNFSRARFSLESSIGFSLPFESFMVAMPNNYHYQGTRMPGLLVTFNDYHESDKSIILPFCKWINLQHEPIIKKEDVAPGSRALSISYRDPYSLGYARLLVPEEKIPKLLTCETLDEFEHIMGYYKQMMAVVKLTREDLEIQSKAIKLVAALGVYNLATQGERLKKGFPGSSVPRMLNRNTETLLSMTTLSSSIPSQLQKSSPEAHYRTWHIRQLRDTRYYKGEYEHAPRGSRFVFVSDSVVNSKITANTQF